MIIDFRTKKELDVFGLAGESWSNELRTVQSSRHWSRILKQLSTECPDSKVEEWFKETWGIKYIWAYDGNVSGLDIDDSSYTMLLIRFPK